MNGTIFYIASFLLLLYCVLIFIYRYWFIRLKKFSENASLLPKTKFSIVIPARNEEKNIEKCLSSIYKNNYPTNLFEVIIIDDESTDSTASIVQEIQTKFSNLILLHISELLHNEVINSYKKKAIELALNRAWGEYIITTDADCIVPENWLINFDNYIQQTNKKFIAAPVAFLNNNSFLGIFQCLDFLSLQGITAASVSTGFHNMCNGANLCYEKNIFFQVNGFNDINHLASGDDMLLMQKIEKQFPDSIGYIFSRESIVETWPMTTWDTFINQRIRWASKATNYNNWKITIVLVLVYLLNLFLLIEFIVCIFYPKQFIAWIILLFIKTVVELLFMQKIALFFKQQFLLKWFAIMQPFHIVYTIVSGFFGQFGKYKWKGRIVK